MEEKKTRTRAPGETGGRIGGGNNYSNNLGSNTQRPLAGNNGLNGQSNRNGPSSNSGINRGSTATRGGGNMGSSMGQNRGGTFNRGDRQDRQPLGQRNATGNVNSSNTYNRR